MTNYLIIFSGFFLSGYGFFRINYQAKKEEITSYTRYYTFVDNNYKIQYSTDGIININYYNGNQSNFEAMRIEEFFGKIGAKALYDNYKK